MTLWIIFLRLLPTVVGVIDLSAVFYYHPCPMARQQNLLAASALLMVLVSCHHALALHHTGSRRLQDDSAAVAASGNAQATATTNGQTIVANGGPGCSTTATLGSNAYAFATGPPCGGKCADIVVGWGQVSPQGRPALISLSQRASRL